MSRVAEVLGVSRSQLHARTSGRSKSRGPYAKSIDDELLPALRRLVDARPTYGYRRIAALLNRERHEAGLAPVNRKRVLRILGQHGLTLERCTGRREWRTHDGKVAVRASNLRWCSDGLEIVCWNGEKVRIAFIIDAFDREIIAHVAVAGAGISGSDVRDMMLPLPNDASGPIVPRIRSSTSPTTAAATPPRTRATSLPLSASFPASRPSDHRRAMA